MKWHGFNLPGSEYLQNRYFLVKSHFILEVMSIGFTATGHFFCLFRINLWGCSIFGLNHVVGCCLDLSNISHFDSICRNG